MKLKEHSFLEFKRMQVFCSIHNFQIICTQNSVSKLKLQHVCIIFSNVKLYNGIIYLSLMIEIIFKLGM